MPSKKPEKGKCGAKIQKSIKKHGEQMYCSKPAGFGTDHNGRGRCKYHGGASTGPNGLTRTTKELKKLLTDEEKEQYRQLPDSLKYDLDEELLTIRNVLKEYQNKKAEELIKDSKSIAVLVKAVDVIRKTVETAHKLKYGEIGQIGNKQVSINFASFIIHAWKIIRDVDDKSIRDRMFYQAVSAAARGAIAGIDRPTMDKDYSIGEVGESKPVCYL